MAAIQVLVELNTYTCYEGHTYAIQRLARNVGCPYCLSDEVNKLLIRVKTLQTKLKRSITY